MRKRAELPVLEVGGEEVGASSDGGLLLVVESHPHEPATLVVLTLSDVPTSFTVNAADLLDACRSVPS